ncbi:hypothetical protein CGH57_23220 [Vibrio parahaemolyticus]|nr:hypothetical protein CGH57_23220 [Vibrio parahaemolyticus]
MFNFINSGIYQRELRSFDASVCVKQDRIVTLITEIIQSVTVDKYYEINLSYKLAGNHPHGPEREQLIESQRIYINSRLDEVVRLFNELNQYCLAR